MFVLNLLILVDKMKMYVCLFLNCFYFLKNLFKIFEREKKNMGLNWNIFDEGGEEWGKYFFLL